MNTELKVASKKLVSRLIWKSEERKVQKDIARVFENKDQNLWWIVGFPRADIMRKRGHTTRRGGIYFREAKDKFPSGKGPIRKG